MTAAGGKGSCMPPPRLITILFQLFLPNPPRTGATNSRLGRQGRRDSLSSDCVPRCVIEVHWACFHVDSTLSSGRKAPSKPSKVHASNHMRNVRHSVLGVHNPGGEGRG